MLDNVRAWWNSVADNLSDPGKLAALSVADLEKAVKSAKEAAAPIVGRPLALEGKLRELRRTDEDLTTKIMALIQSGSDGQEAAKKYVERQVAVKKEISDATEDYEDSKEAADEWQSKIRILETELYSRRNEAARLQADFQTAKAEQKLGKQMQSVDSLMGSDSFSSLRARVDNEKAKAAGYSAMSGLNDKVNDENILKNAETNALMAEYMSKLNKNPSE